MDRVGLQYKFTLMRSVLLVIIAVLSRFLNSSKTLHKTRNGVQSLVQLLLKP